MAFEFFPLTSKQQDQTNLTNEQTPSRPIMHREESESLRDNVLKMFPRLEVWFTDSLRACSAIAEGPNSGPITHVRWLPTIYNSSSSSKRSDSAGTALPGTATLYISV